MGLRCLGRSRNSTGTPGRRLCDRRIAPEIGLKQKKITLAKVKIESCLSQDTMPVKVAGLQERGLEVVARVVKV